MASDPDRILSLCDLLLGAAHADERLDHREQETVRELLADLSDGTLPADVEPRIRDFDPKKFDLAATAAAFKGDSADDKKRLLYLVAAVHESDEELDLAEDAYLKDLAKALELPDEALAGLTVGVEVEELKTAMTTVRKAPPPPPTPKKKRDGSVDVDLDD